VVVFFYRENDNKVHRLHDCWGEAATLDYTYRVIRIWEEPGQVLSESIATIQKVEDVSLQQDLLAAMAIMAGGRYAPELIRTMIRREMVMESPIYQEWVKEERTEAEVRGIGKGKAEKAQDAIYKILNKRLGLDSLKLQQQVWTITSEPVLDWIFDEIVDITSKEAAKNIIETAIKQSQQ
jgi:hypothetical protein